MATTSIEALAYQINILEQTMSTKYMKASQVIDYINSKIASLETSASDVRFLREQYNIIVGTDDNKLLTTTEYNALMNLRIQMEAAVSAINTARTQIVSDNALIRETMNTSVKNAQSQITNLKTRVTALESQLTNLAGQYSELYTLYRELQRRLMS